MKTVVVTTSPSFGTVGPVPGAIAERGWELIRCLDSACVDGGVAAYADRMDILVTGLSAAPADLINRASKLQAILKHGVGVDNIDIAAATARCIPVINAPGTNANAVAELALGCMFSLARRIPMVHQMVVNGGWQRHVGTEIAGKTLGIVGLGSIGKLLALKAQALGMHVLANDLYPDHGFAAAHRMEFCSLEVLLTRSDYVSLHVFGSSVNYHLIGAEQLALMKPGAYLMNFARGDILDLDALIEGLKNEQLLGAAIDAFVDEPPDRTHPVFQHPRVIFTPHFGGVTVESVERMGMMNVSDIDLVLAGQRSPHVLNPEIYN